MDAACLGFEDEEQPGIDAVSSASSDVALYVPTPCTRSHESRVAEKVLDTRRDLGQVGIVEALDKLQEQDKHEELDKLHRRENAAAQNGIHTVIAVPGECEGLETFIAEPGGGCVTITVQSAVNGAEIAKVSIDLKEQCSRIYKAAAKISNMDLSNVSLLYNGEVLDPHKAIEDSGITTDAVVFGILCRRQMSIRCGRCRAVLVDEETGEDKIHFDVGNGLVRCAAWDPDGRSVLIAADFQAARRDCVTRKCVQVYRHKGWVNSACFSADGLHVLTASSDGTAVLWETEAGRAETTLTATASVLHAEFSEEEKHILTFCKGDGDGIKQEWDIGTGVCLQTEHVSEQEVERLHAEFVEKVCRNFQLED